MNTRDYIHHLNATYQLGNATEHSYRGYLQELLGTLLPEHAVTNEPARIACGAPDYIITSKGSGLPVAFIEAKDIGDPDLGGRRANKEQFTRYKEALENLIFTDYLDFHVYQGGEFVDSVRIGEVKGDRIVYLKENEDKFLELVVGHIRVAQPQGISSPRALAKIMAGKARLLAGAIHLALTEGAKDLESQYESFRNVLIRDLKPEAFADIYAQTITYGLFAARLHDESGQDFTRLRAATLIPKTNPFLRKIFQEIAGFDLDPRLAWIVDDLATTFNYVDVEAVMGARGYDPIVHFYEDFLAAYDPQLRKAKGVWYTPQPVVSFIVRAVDEILIRDFGLARGLADSSMTSAPYHRVQILDPATGTGTFLAEIIRHIHSKFEGNQGAWHGYVEQHLIPRLYGFELLMAPYAIAHLKLDIELANTGYQPENDKRLGVYLTNSLEKQHKHTGALFSRWLADEANEANEIKSKAPVMVMMGNPPYNIASSNKGQWILDLIADYRTDLKEINSVALSDDYIKFIRLGQHYIQQTGEGVLAYITNSSYLDGLVHRKMRKQLMETFDAIYILSLHGGINELGPEGKHDQNVFDITLGVAISIFVKKRSNEKKKPAAVYYHELYGKRDHKYSILEKATIDGSPWQQLHPKQPYYFFVPKDFSLEAEYTKGGSLSSLFPLYCSGIETSMDRLLIRENPEEVEKVISDLIGMEETAFRSKWEPGPDVKNWSVRGAKADIGDKCEVQNIRRLHYRPFDARYVYYTPNSTGAISRPRYRVMRHMLAQENLAMVVARHSTTTWNHAFISPMLCDKNYIASAARFGAGFAFPLYLTSPTSTLEASNGQASPTARHPNFNPAELAKIEEALGEKVEPQELFDYIYAVLHSPTYREKYQEFLKIDFPRIPYPSDRGEYQRLVGLGEQLRETHLMENAQSWRLGCTFPMEGDCAVETVRWVDGRVYINDTQYFEGVAKEVWEFYIGG